MIGWRRTTPCERATQWISLDLDGELTELERAGLDRHLDRCPECRRLSAELAGLTTLLRSAPPVEPTGRVVVAASRRRARVASRIGFAAALASVVAVLATLATTRSSSDLLGGSQSALAFADRQQQLRFVHDKVLQMEPRHVVVVQQSLAAGVPALGQRALR
ncbi:MAG TPA: zf-HC2 domain-containing protein [Gaiellaceae bacterium]|nr:zf-HC2 domain-containing protein [Gaiellaceae bacterium]